MSSKVNRGGGLIRLMVTKGVTPNGLAFWESKNVLKLDCILTIAQLCNYLKMIKLFSFSVLMLCDLYLNKVVKSKSKEIAHTYIL